MPVLLTDACSASKSVLLFPTDSNFSICQYCRLIDSSQIIHYLLECIKELLLVLHFLRSRTGAWEKKHLLRRRAGIWEKKHLLRRRAGIWEKKQLLKRRAGIQEKKHLLGSRTGIREKKLLLGSRTGIREKKH